MPPANISSCWELGYGHLDTLNIKIGPLFKEVFAEQVGCKICDGWNAGGQPPVLYWMCLYVFEGMYLSLYECVSVCMFVFFL